MANIVEIIFRQRDAEKVAAASRDLAKSVGTVKPKADEASKGMQELERANQKARQSIQGVSDATKNMKPPEGGAAGFLKLAAAMGLATTGTQILTAAYRKLTETVKAVIQNASDQEQANVRLAYSMQSVGQYSVESLRSMGDWANGIQKATQYADNTVLSIAALIQQLGRLSGDTLKRTTEAALDMSAALGQNAEAIGILLGKAAAGETGSLSRYGIIIDQTLPKSEKFAAVLEKIEQLFGGTAAATVNTYAGAVGQMKNAFSELAEAIGNFVIPSLTQMAQKATDVALKVAGITHALADNPAQTVGEMVQAYDRGLTEIGNKFQRFGEEAGLVLNESLLELQDRAISQIKVEVQKGSLEDAIRVFERLDIAMQTAANKGRTEFVNFIQDLKREADRALELKLKINAETIRDEFRALSKAIGPAVDLDVKLGAGSPEYRAAKEQLERDRENIGKPIEVGVKYVPDPLAQQFPQLFPPGTSKLKMVPNLVPPDAGAIAKAKVEAQEAIDSAGDLRQTVQIAINKGTSIEDMEKIIDELEAKFIEFAGKANIDIKYAFAASDLDRVIQDARKWITSRKSELVVPIGLQLVSEGGESARSSLADVLALYDELARKAQGTTIELIRGRELIRNAEDAAAAIDLLKQSLEAIESTGDVSLIAETYARLNAFLEATADATGEANEAMRQYVQTSVDELEKLLEKLSPLEKARFLEIQVGVAVEAGDIEKAKRLIEEIRKLEAEHPELEIDVVITKALKTLDSLDKEAEASAKRIQSNMESAFDSAIFDSMEMAIKDGFLNIETSTQSWAQRMLEIVVNLVTAIISEWLRMQIITGLGKQAKGGGQIKTPFPQYNPSGLPPGISQGGGAPKPTPLPIPPNALPGTQFGGSELAAKFLPLAVGTQLVVVNANVQALDSSDFERYMRTGPGARALANIAVSRSRW